MQTPQIAPNNLEYTSPAAGMAQTQSIRYGDNMDTPMTMVKNVTRILQANQRSRCSADLPEASQEPARATQGPPRNLSRISCGPPARQEPLNCFEDLPLTQHAPLEHPGRLPKPPINSRMPPKCLQRASQKPFKSIRRSFQTTVRELPKDNI